MNLEHKPRHIAVIMDGNGRWARDRRLPRVMGHREGVKTVRKIVKSCLELQIPFLTLYAFSQENWKRPAHEINRLMQLLEHFLDAELPMFGKEQIRFKVIGHVKDLPSTVQQKVSNLIEKTKTFDRLTLIIALNYGSRREILDAVKRILEER